MHPLVCIIIVNWNGKQLLKKCLFSIKNLNYPQDKIQLILVDNGSTDGSISYINNLSKKIKFIKLKKNLGFSMSNNIGINKAFSDYKPDYIALVNNDVVLDKDWLQNLIETFNKKMDIGAIMGKIYYQDTKVIDSTGDVLTKDFRIVKRGNKEKDTGKYDQEEDIFSCNAAAVLYKCQALKEIQIGNEFFDNMFFAYMEDVDLSLRLKLKGWRCFYQPKAVVFHKVSYTSSKLGKRFIIYHSLRNRIWLIFKLFPQRLIIKALIYNLTPLKFSSNKEVINRLNQVEKISVLSLAIIDAFLRLPIIFYKRKQIYNQIDWRTIKDKNFILFI